MIALALAGMLAFELPAYHVTVTKNGHTFFSAEDLTEKECKRRLKSFKKTDHATCVLNPGEREIA